MQRCRMVAPPRHISRRSPDTGISLIVFALRRARKEAQQQWKEQRHNEIGECDSECEQYETRRTRHADCCNKPDRGSSCQTLNPILPVQDKTCADKADTGDDLRCDAGWIQNNTAFRKNIREAILRDQHKKSGGSADYRLSTQPRALMANFALQPNGGGEQERGAKLKKLLDALPICAWDRHTVDLSTGVTPRLRGVTRQSSHACAGI